MSESVMFLSLFVIASLSGHLVSGIRCNSGANYDSDVLFPTNLIYRECKNTQTFCLRVEATLIRRNEENAKGQEVAAAACAQQHECDQSMCMRILSNYWLINYTSVEGTGSGMDGEYMDMESGMNPIPEDPTFDVRSCKLMCCKDDNCNDQPIASMKPTTLAVTQSTTLAVTQSTTLAVTQSTTLAVTPSTTLAVTPSTSPGGGSSRLSVGLFAIVTPLFLFFRNFYV